MSRFTPIALAMLCALMATPALAAAEKGRLDLDVDPAQVRAWEASPPPHDLVISAPAPKSPFEPDAKAPGWSLRPTVDVDVDQDDGAGAEERSLDVGDLTVDLNSFGLRLQQTW
jgi:hypothetical protein